MFCLHFCLYLSLCHYNIYIVPLPDAEVVAVLCLIPFLRLDVPFFGGSGAVTGSGTVNGGGRGVVTGRRIGAVTGGVIGTVTGGGGGDIIGGGRDAGDAVLSLKSTDTGGGVILSQGILK